MAEVSVLMTVYNGMPYLPLAIESILNQTYSDFEFVIVDDCSSDDSRSTIRSYGDPRIQLIRNETNIGQTQSLNHGLSNIDTPLVARMDADDISHESRLEKQVRYLEEHPDVVAAGTNLRTIDTEGNEIGNYSFPEKDLTLRWMQLFDCPVSCGAVMFKKRIIWDQLGGFEPSIRYAQDWELWSRVLPEHRLANVQEYLLDVREHPGASSVASNKVMLDEQFRINRMNPSRILNIQNRSEDWLQKVDTLLSKKVMKPVDRLEVINVYFERFRQLYPDVSNDPTILKILAQQYLKLLYHTNVHSLPRAISALRSTWLQSSINFNQFTKQCLMSISEIPGHIKYWIRRNVHGLDV